MGKDKRGPAQPVEFNLWLWTHPPVTAGVLVAGMAVLISLVKYSLISVVANISLAVLMAGAACKVYVHLMRFLKKPCTDPLDSVKDIDVTLPGDKVEAFVTSAAETINCVSSSLRSLILVENYVESIKLVSSCTSSPLSVPSSTLSPCSSSAGSVLSSSPPSTIRTRLSLMISSLRLLRSTMESMTSSLQCCQLWSQESCCQWFN